MPTYNFRCKKCDKKSERFFLPSKLESFEKDNKCEFCKGEMERDFGGQSMSFNMKTFKEMDRRDKKFDKKVKEINHADNINKDAYYDVR
jgi:predicted nucleic acid-binding Zn ribbon protein